ncbi:MAG: PEP-CTERM sorting domain-containing protein [Betaproteobacteria bacterium]|nr:PEP-CTERM sorting domain-containing protein [Betaproteobacteria bacterium]
MPTSIPVGSHLITPRRGYIHHGVYVGERVTHYAGFKGFLRAGPVEEVSLESFGGGRGWQVVGRAPNRPEEIVARARSRLGENRYRLLRNNCEHFARWCIEGIHHSEQAEVATFDSAGEFAAFSPTKLFATLGSAITDVTFSVPGSPGEVADVIGFGAVFTDVDITGLTSIEYFNAQGGSLGSFTVPGVFPVGTGENSQASFSFLGVSFSGGDRVSRVRITSGSHGVDGVYVGVEDAVVMDDFIYGEPVARRAVSEPATLLLLGACALGWCARRKTPLM